MAVRAVVFDIGGVLEVTPDLGVAEKWERELAGERLGVRPEEMAFLDDVPEFVEAARRAGLQAVLFTGNQQAIAGIEALLHS